MDRTEQHNDIEITTDGRKVWLNTRARCVGRFSRDYLELTLRDGTDHTVSWRAVETTDRPGFVRMMWTEWTQLVQKHLGVTLDDTWLPTLEMHPKATLPRRAEHYVRWHRRGGEAIQVRGEGRVDERSSPESLDVLARRLPRPPVQVPEASAQRGGEGRVYDASWLYVTP
jgi:hypothetical protein